MLPQHFDLRAEYSRVTPSPFSRRFFQNRVQNYKKNPTCASFCGIFLIRRSDFYYSIILISLAGLPPTMALAGTSLVTTAAAATTAFSPTDDRLTTER